MKTSALHQLIYEGLGDEVRPDSPSVPSESWPHRFENATLPQLLGAVFITAQTAWTEVYQAEFDPGRDEAPFAYRGVCKAAQFIFSLPDELQLGREAVRLDLSLTLGAHYLTQSIDQAPTKRGLRPYCDVITGFRVSRQNSEGRYAADLTHPLNGPQRLERMNRFTPVFAAAATGSGPETPFDNLVTEELLAASPPAVSLTEIDETEEGVFAACGQILTAITSGNIIRIRPSE